MNPPVDGDKQTVNVFVNVTSVPPNRIKEQQHRKVAKGMQNLFSG